jgi:hypothetical protein
MKTGYFVQKNRAVVLARERRPAAAATHLIYYYFPIFPSKIASQN